MVMAASYPSLLAAPSSVSTAAGVGDDSMRHRPPPPSPLTASASSPSLLTAHRAGICLHWRRAPERQICHWRRSWDRIQIEWRWPTGSATDYGAGLLRHHSPRLLPPSSSLAVPASSVSPAASRILCLSPGIHGVFDGYQKNHD
uniref:Uncharacterized protein n=1 Tax=Leersia perrieri TaxID=77586 RepID=A0A0D9WD78_9ORYZ